MSVIQLGYLGLNVRDTGAWEKFAADFIGLQVWPDRGEDGTVYLRMDERHHRFMLTPSDSEGVFCTGWEVANAQALVETVSRLKANGVKVTPGTEAEARKRRVWEFVKFDDPTGLSGELYYGAHVDHRPFKPGRAVSGFVTGVCGMGHLVVGVEKAAPVVAFYRDLLGFRLTDYIVWAEQKVDVTFLHCNPRHHSIAFVEGANVPARVLNHFMVETHVARRRGARLRHRGRDEPRRHPGPRPPQQRQGHVVLRGEPVGLRRRVRMGRDPGDGREHVDHPAPHVGLDLGASAAQEREDTVRRTGGTARAGRTGSSDHDRFLLRSSARRSHLDRRWPQLSLRGTGQPDPVRPALAVPPVRARWRAGSSDPGRGSSAVLAVGHRGHRASAVGAVVTTEEDRMARAMTRREVVKAVVGAAAGARGAGGDGASEGAGWAGEDRVSVSGSGSVHADRVRYA